MLAFRKFCALVAFVIGPIFSGNAGWIEDSTPPVEFSLWKRENQDPVLTTSFQSDFFFAVNVYFSCRKGFENEYKLVVEAKTDKHFQIVQEIYNKQNIFFGLRNDRKNEYITLTESDGLKSVTRIRSSIIQEMDKAVTQPYNEYGLFRYSTLLMEANVKKELIFSILNNNYLNIYFISEDGRRQDVTIIAKYNIRQKLLLDFLELCSPY